MARPGLTGHRKFRRLVRALGSPIVARGALELLWDSCYESGVDYVGTSDDIETLVGWDGEHGMLTRALVEAGAPEGQGFIEVVATTGTTLAVAYRVHDLWHHAPEYVAKRRKRELDRQQKIAPAGVVGHPAPSGADFPRSAKCQIGVPPPPSPSPSPSPVQQPLRSATAKRETTLLDAATPAMQARLTAEELVDMWNALVSSPIPKITKLTNDRKAKLEARLKTFPDRQTWETVIRWINGQDWCRASGSGEHPNWTATLDWLCKNDGTVQRWLERANTTIRRSASRSGPELFANYPIWDCPHTPRCPHRAACAVVAARTKVS